jgi:protoporphyrinogen oxidase
LHTGSLAQLGVIADLPDEYADALGRIGYRAVACALFKLKRRYDRFYWLNNGDDSLFIGGIIEHTNFVDEEAYGGHMVYAFAYLDPDDTMLNDTKALRDIFLRDMKAISPTFDSGDVVSVVISSNRYATPVYDVGYLQKMPKVKTPIEGLFLAGMTGVYPMDRNMDNAINAGFEAAGVIGDSFLKK